MIRRPICSTVPDSTTETTEITENSHGRHSMTSVCSVAKKLSRSFFRCFPRVGLFPVPYSLFPFILLLTGCFETTRVYTAQHHYYEGRYEDAATAYDDINVPKRDRLIMLLEKGMALQAAGLYAESAEAWREADMWMEKADVFHLGEQALSLVFDQNILGYQPAPYEKPFLHALLALDYLQLHDLTAARVEALKSLKDLEGRERIVGPINFPRYVAAMVYETCGDNNDAYIEYKKIHASGVAGVVPTLVRLSGVLGFDDDRARWLEAQSRPAEGDTGTAPTPTADGMPVLLFLGRSPKKVPSEVVLPDGYKVSLPVFQSQENDILGARLSTPTPTGTASQQDGFILTSVETLAANYSGKLFAKELLKEIVRMKVQKEMLEKVKDKVGDTAEDILKTVFFFAKAADLRTWGSLPATIQVAYVPGNITADPVAVQYKGASHVLTDRSDTITLEPEPPADSSSQPGAQPAVPARFKILRAW